MDVTPDLTLHEHPQHIFPTLTPSQIARVTPYGTSREVAPGQVLVEQGDRDVPFLLVISGTMEVLRPGEKGEASIAVLRAGEFNGDVGMLSDR